MHPRAVLFDLDGTLLYTIGDIANAMNRVLEAHGHVPKSEAEYTGLVGWGIKRLAELSIPEGERTEERIAQYAGEVVDAYHAEPTVATTVYDGIESLLDELKERKIPCAALSNKLDSLTRVIVDRMLDMDRFRVVQGALAGVPNKPDPTSALEIARKINVDAAACLFVGDTPIDVETARNAGMPSCAVTWGYRPVEELREAKPDFLIDRPAEVLEIIDELKAASTIGGAL